MRNNLPAEDFVLEYACPESEEPFKTHTIGRILSATGMLFALMGYALCYNVGRMAIYRMQRIGRIALHLQYHARRALHRRQRQMAADVRGALHAFFTPLRRALELLTYIRSARSPLREEDRVQARTVTGVVASRILHGVWRLLMSCVNIAAPIAALILLVHAVQYFTDVQYGLVVEYNGAHIGNVETEAQFYEAESRMRARIINEQYKSPDDTIPRFTLEQMPASSFTDVDVLADRMIRLSGNDLFEGFGLYIDGVFKGALTNADALLSGLADRLDSASTGTPGESVRFNHDFSIQPALYPVTSKVDLEKIEALFTSTLSAEKKYTVIAGDTPIEIAQKNGIAYRDLKALNPEIETSLFPGDELMIAHSVPYLRIVAVRRETVEEEIPFAKSREIDNEKLVGTLEVEQEGVNGRRRTVSDVTYIDGERMSTEVIESRVLEAPIPEITVAGGKQPEDQVVRSNDIIDASGTGMFLWPVDGGRITMPIWGYAGHTGNDITGIVQGTTVRAAASGVVTKVKYDAGGYGRHVVVQHENGFETLYAHNSALMVQVGDQVVQGQKIAEVGQTGRAYGNHCHFEIRKNGQYLDARQYVGTASPR